MISVEPFNFPPPMDSVSYIVINLTALVVGQLLVTRGHWAGFLVWSLCNVYSVVICVVTGIPATSCLFIAYLFVNLYSLRSWLGKRFGGMPSAGAAVTIHRQAQTS
jgi:nicotinamide riboside transporter PnuC